MKRAATRTGPEKTRRTRTRHRQVDSFTHPHAPVPVPAPVFAPDFEAKIVAPEGLPAALAALPRPLVFTNGCFDILHRGHVTLLAQARALGASMIVALNSDASIRQLDKSNDRPVNTLADRLAVIAALKSVLLVTWFEEDTPIERILECCPDVLVRAATGRRKRSSAIPKSPPGAGVRSPFPLFTRNQRPRCWKKSGVYNYKPRDKLSAAQPANHRARRLSATHSAASRIGRAAGGDRRSIGHKV